MNNDPIFNIHFVRVIENYRCLWDHTHEDYGKKDEIDKAWRDVVSIMHDSGEYILIIIKYLKCKRMQ